MITLQGRVRTVHLPAITVVAVFLLGAGTSGAQSSGSPGPRPSDSRVLLLQRRYDLAKPDDLRAFAHEVDRLSALAEEQHKAKKSGDQDEDASAPAPSVQRDMSSKEARHTLKYMRDGTETLLAAGQNDRVKGIRAVQDLTWTFESKWIIPWTWQASMEILDIPFHSRGMLLRSVGRGSASSPASDLQSYGVSDLSKTDPLPSPFWRRPDAISSRDLYCGFGRHSLPAIAVDIVSFDREHKGYGAHANFQAAWNDERWKVKFGEQHTEPFGTRIFWALGFPVYPTDWASEIKVRYDRRILSGLNKRKSNVTRLNFAGLTVLRSAPNSYHSPFNFIRSAVLRDGTSITAAELRSRLFPQTRTGRPELTPKLYDAAFEKRIDYLVMTDANVRRKDTEGQEALGFWDYNSYGHADRRALRGMALLHAWLESWDVRWGNNEMRTVDDGDGSPRVEEVVSDLGTIFGESSGLLRFLDGHLAMGMIPGEINPYPWSFTRPLRAGQTAVPIDGYMPLVNTAPFSQMNVDDARWMARLIGQLTENQLRQALIASGYEAPEARLLLEKLVSRRDRMVQDLGLAGDIPLLRSRAVDRKIKYDARIDGPFEATLASGATVAARDSGDWVVLQGAMRRRPVVAALRPASSALSQAR